MQEQNSQLKNHIYQLQKECQMLNRKIIMLQSRQGISASQITLINKQLYLSYMQQVLSSKQVQLLQRQGNLQRSHLNLLQKQQQSFLLNPLQKSTQIDIILGKLQQIKRITINSQKQIILDRNQWLQYFRNQDQIIKELKLYQTETQKFIKNQYQILIRQRKQYQQNMDRFQQLNSYEKYLNQLQLVLEVKQQLILKKEDQLLKIKDDLQSSSRNAGTISFGQPTGSREAPQRKRSRIFNSVQKKSQKINQSNAQSFEEIKKTINTQVGYDQSSYIMRESQYNDSALVKKLYNFQSIPSVRQQMKQQVVSIEVESIGIQSNIEQLPQSIIRLQRQRKILKFTTLWLKYSLKSKKSLTNPMKKTIGLYLWRLNSLYDSQIVKKVSSQEFVCPVKLQNSLKSKKMFPYNQLSLKRKKYAELTFDLQKKMFHKKKIQNSLKHIIKNKARKQRFMVFLCFKKFTSKIKIQLITDNYKSQTTMLKSSNKQTMANDPTSRWNAQSRVITANSSRIMNQNRILPNQVKEQQRSKLNNGIKLVNKCLSSSSLIAKQNIKVSKVIKQNLNPSTLDLQKLKQYILQQQLTQKSLAIQCVKTQATFKLGQSLTNLLNKRLISMFYLLKSCQQNQKTIQLERRINGYEFKWQLFVTKCKLAIVNSSNKISHLQDTLQFMIGKK